MTTPAAVQLGRLGSQRVETLAEKWLLEYFDDFINRDIFQLSLDWGFNFESTPLFIALNNLVAKGKLAKEKDGAGVTVWRKDRQPSQSMAGGSNVFAHLS